MVRRSQQRIPIGELAALQYVGLNGITQPCVAAIARQLSNLDDPTQNAALLSCASSHGFLLFTEYSGAIAVKPGFTSGYPGEGPRGLASTLELLERHNVDVEEHVVDQAFFERLENSCLLHRDIDAIVNGRPVRPRRLYDYVHGFHEDEFDEPTDLSPHYPQTIPFGLIDVRISDLAVRFSDGEDAAILSAFRRLEDQLRKRTGLNGEGASLFAKIFLAEHPVLTWDVPDKGEIKGRANLYNAVYMAFRNARAHREIDSGSAQALREFLLVNELFRLEGEAMTLAELKKKRDDEASLEKALSSLKIRSRRSKA